MEDDPTEEFNESAEENGEHLNEPEGDNEAEIPDETLESIDEGIEPQVDNRDNTRNTYTIIIITIIILSIMGLVLYLIIRKKGVS